MQIDITQIALALIALMSAVVTGFIIPWLKSKINVNNDKLTDNQRMLIDLAIDTAVTAAEQLFNSEEGQKKKAYVINVLAEQGYILDKEKVDEAMNAAIEAAVYAIHQKNIKVKVEDE